MNNTLFRLSIMGAVPARYPLGIPLHSHGGALSRRVDFTTSHFPVHLDLSRIALCPRSASEEFIDRVCARSDIDDFDWEWDEVPTPILDTVENPLCLKNLSLKELKQLAAEIRLDLSSLMSDTQISPTASMAVSELTVAMHHVFHAPVDKILWDVGDQTYAHKILTGRRPLMKTMRQKNGLSGFTSRSESEYDAFGSGHGCNSISAGLGMAVARDIKGRRERIIAVISNWTTMAGQVYEAMSNAGCLDSNMVVILNDSRHSLLPKIDEGPTTSVSALSSTLSRLQSSKSFRRFREAAKGVTKRIGRGMHEWAAKVDEYARGMMGPLGATLFEELGLYYIGPVDGHNMEDLVCVLQEVASLDSMGPVLVHVITDKNQGVENNQKSDITDRHQSGTNFYRNCIAYAPFHVISSCVVAYLAYTDLTL